jgi:methylated-DNA-[protein]-cysteine S-methyltransferase
MNRNDEPRDADSDLGREIARAVVTASPDASSLAARFAERAAEVGLLDVAYATVESPFGPLMVAATPRGLVSVGLPNLDQDRFLATLTDRVSPRVLEAPARLDEARRALDLYFEGRLREFDLPLDWQLSRGFRRRVLRHTARIPYGQTRSYKQMAERAGSPRAVRAAGSALGSNPIPIVVPCHRVLRSGGALGGYGGGLELKRALLELEGALEG